MEIKETDNKGLYNPYSLGWDDTIMFPSTRKLKQYGNRVYNRYPARSIFLVPRATILSNKNNNKELNILDPFMGSGTTAVEATNLNCRIYGTEMDPFARLIAEVSVAKFSSKEQEEILENYNEIVNNWKNQRPIRKYYPDLKNVEYWFDDSTFNDLLKLKSYIYENITNEKYLKFFKITFADCIKPSSKMERQSTKPYISSKYAKKIKPVELEFSRILDNGCYRVDYSETLKKLDNILPGAQNLTMLNENRKLVLQPIFMQANVVNNSLIENWKFRDFT